jgi:hypothetical protein
LGKGFENYDKTAVAVIVLSLIAAIGITQL